MHSTVYRLSPACCPEARVDFSLFWGVGDGMQAMVAAYEMGKQAGMRDSEAASESNAGLGLRTPPPPAKASTQEWVHVRPAPPPIPPTQSQARISRRRRGRVQRNRAYKLDPLQFGGVLARRGVRDLRRWFLGICVPGGLGLSRFDAVRR